MTKDTTRTYIRDTKDNVGQEVKIAGWIDVRRDHGKLTFLDIRDKTGLIQAVALPNHKEAHETAHKLRPEWVVEVTGLVNKRPEKMINPDLETGEVELEITDIKILNEATTPPFEISTDGKEIGEEHRLEYRYIDLRRGRMQKNLLYRHKIIKFIRDYLSEKDFIEVETPILSKSTPEGARDFLVPSRGYQGKFYALPQAPQQYKQILMTSGVEKYFQIARCFRDEDTRGDRQPEFTQLDLEMAFVNREDVMALNESLLINIIKEIFPSKTIQEVPFPRISYKEAMEKYDTDRPDLRKDKNDPDLLAFCWVIDFPFFERDDKDSWTFTHNPFSAAKEEDYEKLKNKEDIGSIISNQYDVALNGSEIAGGSTRNHEPGALKSVLEIIGYSEKDIETHFAHMFRALTSGAPPHGGIAWGLDRLVSILLDEPNIREVIAFPKTGEGRDLMMDAPDDVEKTQLNELGLEIKKDK